MAGEVRYLVMVTQNNNNKFYKQTKLDDYYWEAEYGRIGGSVTKVRYPMHTWESKYNEKIRKGYTDNTHLIESAIEEKNDNKTPYKEIENAAIAEIVDRLQKMARKAISDNYTVSSTIVTQASIDAAQKIINSLVEAKTIAKFNSLLMELFQVIPRKMSTVTNYVAKKKEDFSYIITREQALLDTMKTQVEQDALLKKKQIEEAKEKNKENQKENTILEELGLVFEECDSEDIAKIQMALGDSVDKLRRAWKVTNIQTQKKFDDFVKENEIKETKMLFHGSRNENWWSIISSGLALKPTNAVITGKLYGMGIYFAPKARKSVGYTSLQGSYWARGSSDVGYMALMEVAYGTPYDVYDFNSKYHSLNYNELQKFKKGANCLHAHAGASMGYSSLRNDEIVIYKEEQCTIKYLVEIA